jgi:hypothetical protein
MQAIMRNHYQQHGRPLGFNNIMMNHFGKSRDKITSLFRLTPLLLLATGCHQDQVQVYQVASDRDPSAQSAASTTNLSNPALPPGHPDISTMGSLPGQMPASIAASDTQNTPPLSWTTPAGWTEVAPAAMRVASFKIAGAGGQTADLSIVPLSGLAGGDIANVNRWRGQAGLPPAEVDVLQNSAQNVEAGGQPAQLYDIGGASSRILGVIQHRNDKTWFYKMTGDPALVEQQKPAFIAFLQSLNFPSQQSQAALPTGHPDLSTSANAATDSAAPISHEGQPAWQVPSGWQEVSGGQFLIAKFLIPGAGGQRAAVNISRSIGDGGGLAANVNRWRGQLGLPPANDISTIPVQVKSGDAVLVDLSGVSIQTGQPGRVLAVAVNQSGQSWFYKMMGDPSIVASQRDAFLHFVEGVNY